MQRSNLSLAIAALLSNAMPLAAQGTADSVKIRAREEVQLRGYLGGAAFHNQTGPGRVTVFTHSNYVNDPRRKWYGLGGKWP